ncbi:MAG TPA: DEAD/DEAH box helicase [Blastocatellia bacterium]|nr:DEAD/DEAH box helicase [Blastocatellia bacterium]
MERDADLFDYRKIPSSEDLTSPPTLPLPERSTTPEDSSASEALLENVDAADAKVPTEPLESKDDPDALPTDPIDFKDHLDALIRQQGHLTLKDLNPGLHAFSKDGDLLLLAAFAALYENRPDQCLIYHKRYLRRYLPFPISHLAYALAVAQKGNWQFADSLVKKHQLRNAIVMLRYYLPGGDTLARWAGGKLTEIHREAKARDQESRRSHHKPGARSKARREDPARAVNNKTARSIAVAAPDGGEGAVLPPLVRLPASISTSFDLPEPETIPLPEGPVDGTAWFRLRSEFSRLGLFQGFDELLCLPLLHNVTSYWYQIETVRKVLKQFRGRVLLADEVGLGKTIEAGMVLKEYILRGMAERVLILTPASIVGQWLEEMTTKFDVGFASTHDNAVRSDPPSFWSRPRIIASIATARRAEHFEILRRQVYDIVIVDEAHHLKDRATTNWKLVDALQKRFLLLLTATPVQNSLIELFNLLRRAERTGPAASCRSGGPSAARPSPSVGGRRVFFRRGGERDPALRRVEQA